ncbi:MAG: glycosyltransferase family 39 protein, partial [Anaerolineaceae bacterium]|nr:glycosyltransferase family 39 protein [Anaerolineaceae bacterium]
MALQAALYAIFPATLYLLVKSLSNRPAGVAAALMITFRGINSIASASWINSGNPKQMLTDFPTAIGLGLCCLFVVLALKKPGWRYFYIFLAGGAIGLASLLRTNVLMVIPFIALILVIHYWRNYGRWLVMIVLLLGGSLLAVYPWGLRNQTAGVPSIQSMYLGKFQNVIRRRYPKVVNPTPAPTPLPAIVSPLELDQDLLPDQETDDPFVLSLDQIFFSELIDESPELNRAMNVASFVSELTYHNIATSLLVIPTDFYFYKLYPILRVEYPYWDTNWDWRIPSSAVPNLLLNLGLISLGISLALRNKAVGLTPVCIFLGYQFANGFARTAGGRYIVPVDWIVIAY